MKNLLIVRHGETDFNKEDRYAGSTDIDLNERGIQQAYDIAKESEKFKIDLIITSPLKRCRSMAEIIKNNVQKPLLITDAFQERSLGVFEGLTREEAKSRHPDLWAKNITRIFNDAPTGGETIQDVEQRVFSGLEKIKLMEGYHNFLIVTHAFVGKIIHKYFYPMTEAEFFEYKLENAQIIKYEL